MFLWKKDYNTNQMVRHASLIFTPKLEFYFDELKAFISLFSNVASTKAVAKRLS